VKNAPALMFGRATSALDAESERLGRQALDRMADQRTTIVIADQLATAQKANRIVVMENGRSVDRFAVGPHAKHLYVRFAVLQFSRRYGEYGKAASMIVAPERA
jgi:subfamily B ATP-binding cassette protein MsbA